MSYFTELTGNIMKQGMAITLLIFFATVSGIAPSPVLAADSANGKKLHDAKCTSCHDTRQYTRKNRIIHTYEDLHARVEFCDGASDAGFSFDDIDDVVNYLNDEFYKFKK